MDGTADDELAGQLADLTRRLRDQLVRHAALGAWAAPGGPTARTAMAIVDEPEADDASLSAAPVIDVDDGAGESAPARLAVPRDEPMPSIAPISLGRKTLPQIRAELGECTRCKLHTTRRSIVFGVGAADTPLMFVGEAPGFHEDKQGLPFVGQAGKLLEKLLAQIGLQRSDVYVANVLKCRPPGNRNPQPDEIEACESHLFRQIELIEPVVVATLGNFATKLLSGRQLGITKVHGQEQETTLGGRKVLLYPLYHPAAALYTP
ncbi:MAG: uracil-DNA glycosylase, partial [bacterium]